MPVVLDGLPLTTLSYKALHSYSSLYSPHSHSVTRRLTATAHYTRYIRHTHTQLQGAAQLQLTILAIFATLTLSYKALHSYSSLYSLYSPHSHSVTRRCTATAHYTRYIRHTHTQLQGAAQLQLTILTIFATLILSYKALHSYSSLYSLYSPHSHSVTRRCTATAHYTRYIRHTHTQLQGASQLQLTILAIFATLTLSYKALHSYSSLYTHS